MKAPAQHLKLKAPFPWFGGKSRAAGLVWSRFGNVPNYSEPFAGSLAVLLGRPTQPGNEIVNDLDCYVANAWRAMKYAPEKVAEAVDWPVNEADLHARHTWLHQRAEFRERMKTDPDYFDARIAAYWMWGVSCWIGDNFCRPSAQHSVPQLRYGKGVARQVPYLTTGGQGSVRQIPTLRGASGQIVERKRPSVHPWKGMDQSENLRAWFEALSARLRFTKVCGGDWSRVVTKAATYGQGLTGVLLDPPYDPELCDTVYGDCHDANVSAEVRAWALANGGNPLLRIALCGYIGEHDMPADWECVAWKASGGYASAAGNNENSRKERIWFSPHCKRGEQTELFSGPVEP